ncbi:MAG: class II glutamine amidotransferase [Yoonia sp.]|nr:class II glutamine amidotransferase [Yoonia sp.]
MCQIAVYSGPAIPLENIIVRPAHSLLDQSQHVSEAKLAVNGDGFGIAWYGDDDRPGLYRDVLPAWADGNLTSLCRMVRSHRFIAHIRASTMGETSRTNCHPFTHGNWAFCHNGQVPPLSTDQALARGRVARRSVGRTPRHN